MWNLYKKIFLEMVKLPVGSEEVGPVKQIIVLAVWCVSLYVSW